jgi:hypothetical protein
MSIYARKLERGAERARSAPTENQQEAGETDQHHAARNAKAASGETRVQSAPATALAARFPKDCVAARRPKADPRTSSGAFVATTACSAVSTKPIPAPAMI